MDISKYAKDDVLRVLYDNARTQGMGLFHYMPGNNMTKAEALECLKNGTYFDYLKGRVMKVDLSKDELDTRLYNRDNGVDAAEKAIKTLDNLKPKRMIQI